MVLDTPLGPDVMTRLRIGMKPLRIDSVGDHDYFRPGIPLGDVIVAPCSGIRDNGIREARQPESQFAADPRTRSYWLRSMLENLIPHTIFVEGSHGLRATVTRSVR
jgi:hypothetical protein